MRIAGILAVLAALSLTAQAALVVDFGGVDYLGNNSAVTPSYTYSVGDFDGDGFADDQEALAAFNETTPIAFNAAYLGQPIYGGLRATATNDIDYFQTVSSLFMKHIIRGNSTGADFYRGQSANLPDAHGTFQVAVAWMKGDFLNGGDSSPVIFDSTSSLSVTDNASYRLEVGRFIVKDAGVYYVSEQTFNFAESSTETMTFASDDNDGNWAVWDQSLGFLPTSFSPQNFTDIQAAGLLMQQNGHDSNMNAVFNIAKFEVNATVVPEPASLGLLALGGLLLRRRR